MKTVICYYSSHHGNTRKVVEAMAEEGGAALVDLSTQPEAALEEYDLIGFASGIYAFSFHPSVVKLARERLPRGKRVFCVYTYGGTDISPATIVGKRDSIMAANLPGESPGSHVTTETEAPIFCAETHTANGTASTMLRGLWKMEGGAMGGPFVCRAVADSAKGRTVVAEGFAYAPGKPKRSMMKQLEAALLTLQPN